MEVEKGYVEKTQDGWAWIVTYRRDACDHCGQKGFCQMSDGGDKMVVKAKNALGAKIGDEVEIYLSAGKKFKVLFIVYIFPVLGLLSGAILGHSIAPLIGLKREIGTMVFTFLGLFLTFLIIPFFSHRLDTSGQMIPLVSRITRRATDSSIHHSKLL
jgi:sigma-E factor negative regulatory protein RseC